MNSSLTKLEDKKVQRTTTKKMNIFKRTKELNKEVVREFGVLEKNDHLEEYISRLLYGTCYIFEDGLKKVFCLPEEKDRLRRYLGGINPKKEIMVDLSPVAICLLISKKYMYSLHFKY